MKLIEHIKEHHDSNVSEFARLYGVRHDQVGRWVKRECIIEDGKVYCEVSKNVKKEVEL